MRKIEFVEKCRIGRNHNCCILSDLIIKYNMDGRLAPYIIYAWEWGNILLSKAI